MRNILKKIVSAPFVLSAIFLAGCADMDYDISEGYNKEVTLFENEFSAPIGSIGPLTIGSTLGGASKAEGMVGMISEYIKQDASGLLYLEDKGNLYKINVYEIERQQGDVSEPFTWKAGSPSGSVGGFPSIVSYIGLGVSNQKLDISYTNPFASDIPIRCNGSLMCLGADWLPSYQASLTVPGLLGTYVSNKPLASHVLPPEVTDVVRSFSLGSLEFDLPANPTSQLMDRNESSIISIDYLYRCGVTVGETFAIRDIEIPAENINLEIGKYKLKKCKVSLEVENTLPLTLTLDRLSVLKRQADAGDEESGLEPDTNILVTEGLSIKGGSEANPALSTLTLEVEAVEGTIPDITDLHIILSVTAPENLGAVALKANQGLYIKSSSARISGGITIPANE